MEESKMDNEKETKAMGNNQKKKRNKGCEI
jgi:hypothetical protein